MATTARPYREKLSLEEGVDHLGSLSGRVISPEVFAAISSVVGGRRALVFVDEEAGQP